MHDPRRVDQKSTDRANDRLAVTPVKELSELGNDLRQPVAATRNPSVPMTFETASFNH
jgi:hypothetical protein